MRPSQFRVAFRDRGPRPLASHARKRRAAGGIGRAPGAHRPRRAAASRGVAGAASPCRCRPALPPGYHRLAVERRRGQRRDRADRGAAPLSPAFGAGRALLGAHGAALRAALGAQLGHRRFHRSRHARRRCGPARRGRARHQPAACALPRRAPAYQPLFAFEPAVSQSALYRCRGGAGFPATAWARAGPRRAAPRGDLVDYSAVARLKRPPSTRSIAAFARGSSGRQAERARCRFPALPARGRRRRSRPLPPSPRCTSTSWLRAAASPGMTGRRRCATAASPEVQHFAAEHRAASSCTSICNGRPTGSSAPRAARRRSGAAARPLPRSRRRRRSQRRRGLGRPGLMVSPAPPSARRPTC